MVMMKENTFIQWHSSNLWLLKYFHIQQPQIEFITSVSTAGFVETWIWPFILGRALENLFNWPLPVQRYFALWWDLDHDLKFRVKMRKGSTHTQVGLSPIITSNYRHRSISLSGSFGDRYSLSLKQKVNGIRIGSVRRFASNAKGDQFFSLQTSPVKSTHHLEVVWPNQQILCFAKTSSHTEHCV